MRRLIAVVMLLFACRSTPPAEPAAAAGGTIEGRVMYAGTPPREEDVLLEDPEVQEVFGRVTIRHRPARVDSETGGVSGVLIWLTDEMGRAPEGCEPVPTFTGIDAQRLSFTSSGAYDPPVLIVPPAGRVELRNGTMRAGMFDAELYDPHGSEWTYWARESIAVDAAAPFRMPNRMGLARFRHQLCPWTTGYALATPSPYATLTPTDGSFRFTGVPPGRHVLRVFHGELGTRRIVVEVGEGETTVIDVTYP